jgi:hypothetical protein
MLGAEDADAQTLLPRALHYARKAGANQETLGVNDRRGKAGGLVVAVPAGGAAAGVTPSHPCLPTHAPYHPNPPARVSPLLNHRLTAAILALPEEQLNAYLVNDAYKPRMHK